jgi:bacillopeptidase F
LNLTKIALAILTAMLLTAGIASAREGGIAPGLAEQLDRTAQDSPIRALVVMKDQVDIPSLDQELRAARAPLSERHEVVIRALQETAKGSQSGLLAELATEKAAGRVKGFASHWLINAVLVEGTPDVLRSLALREDVEKLEADLVIKSSTNADKDGSAEPAPASPLNVGNGLQALGVPEVWRQLGFDGTGQVVGIMDTGVDAAHAALSGSWRGNSAPVNECWLDLIDTGSPDYPVDVHYLGTVHAGLMVGHANGDTVGVAPGAEWIASNHLFQYSGPEFDADVITSLEFMADPDGNPATLNDVPAVVLNAWGIDESYEGYFDCDNRWWDAMDACEAAGPVLIFSAGDMGPSSTSIKSPADRADTETAGLGAFRLWRALGDQAGSGGPRNRCDHHLSR